MSYHKFDGVKEYKLDIGEGAQNIQVDIETKSGCLNAYIVTVGGKKAGAVIREMTWHPLLSGSRSRSLVPIWFIWRQRTTGEVTAFRCWMPGTIDANERSIVMMLETGSITEKKENCFLMYQHVFLECVR